MTQWSISNVAGLGELGRVGETVRDLKLRPSQTAATARRPLVIERRKPAAVIGCGVSVHAFGSRSTRLSSGH